VPGSARIGDPTSHGGTLAPPGVPTVLIEGMPAAVMGGLHICAIPPATPPHPTTTPIVAGSATVLIGGQPAARMGDSAACGATIVVGSTRVVIG
jgi:uncharacterized Zn-binding protein involved in type VI secretion